MRIVNLKEFNTLPEGTVYCRNAGGAFGDMEVIHTQLSDGNWSYRMLSPVAFVVDDDDDEESYFKTLERSWVDGSDIEMDFDAVFVNSDHDEFQGMQADSGKYTFAVFSKQDITAMVERLTKALK
jgi:hypothetical protein